MKTVWQTLVIFSLLGSGLFGVSAAPWQFLAGPKHIELQGFTEDSINLTAEKTFNLSYGNYRTGGYTLDVNKVVVSSKKRTITFYVDVIAPPPESFVTQAFAPARKEVKYNLPLESHPFSVRIIQQGGPEPISWF